ncbi:MAG TPA: transporter [Cryomorphaceae bacterium]|nr:transporter [Cryomorphaceae bacterium]
MKKLAIIGIVLLCIQEVRGQDSTYLFSYEKFMDQVRNHHPLAMQAELAVERGEARLQRSRGGFDPKVFSQANQKYFDGTTYYRLWDSGLKIPTWYGIEVKGGFEKNDGTYLNPENSTSDGGFRYAGLSLPIGQRLFIDQRRASLKQAKIYQESTLAERRILLNELLLEAGKAYWNWFEAYHTREVYEDAYLLSTERMRAIKSTAILGDRPFIDTLEAGIQVQNRLLALQEARMMEANARELASVYLWNDGSIPLEIDAQTRPEDDEIDQFSFTDPALDTLSFNSDLPNLHPELERSRLKIDELKVEERLKREQLKPVVDLKYNLLTQPVGDEGLSELTANNYQWGISFGIPIFLRKERGDLKLTRLKIQSAEWDLLAKRQNIQYKLRSSFNEWETTRSQISIMDKTVKDYSSLLEGERTMFDAGESSLFMINSRESAYINSRIKLIQLVSKNQVANAKVKYALGNLSGR